MRKTRIATLARKIIPLPEPGLLLFRSPPDQGDYRRLDDPTTHYSIAQAKEIILGDPFRWTDGRHTPKQMSIIEFGTMIGLYGTFLYRLAENGTRDDCEFFRARDLKNG